MSFSNILVRNCVTKSKNTLAYQSIRQFAHNPKWLREQTRRETNFKRLKEELLAGTHTRRPQGVYRRIAKIHNRYSKKPSIVTKENVVFEPYTTPDAESWIFSLNRHRVGILPLPKEVYDADVSRTDIIHTVVNWQRACARQGTHKSMNRHEMSGTTRKYRRQKGTGGARSSDHKSPIFRGGAYAHPRRPRDYSYKIPTNVRRLGLKIILSSKRKEGRLAFVDAITSDSHKSSSLKYLQEKWNNPSKILIIHGDYEEDPNFVLAARHNPSLHLLPARGANVLDIIKSPLVIITLQGHLDLTQRLTKSNSIVNQVTDTIELMSEEDAAIAREKFLAQLHNEAN